MYLVGKNLERLVEQKGICDVSLVDDFSLTVKLGSKFFRPVKSGEKTIHYGYQSAMDEFFEEENPDGELSLNPGDSILACSQDQFSIPPGYIGFLFTKGTLARMFVSLTANDPQIEPGFSGFITMELTNHSPWTIDLLLGSKVGQLYIAYCSNSHSSYNGRYSEAAKEGPTLPILKND